MKRPSQGRTKLGTRRMAGSVNRFSRKGRTASGASGPPRLNSTTATRRMLVLNAVGVIDAGAACPVNRS